ncbi:MAG: hypothetical protein WBG08_13150 [Litorimonas sp.]
MTIILGGTFAALSGGSAPQAADLAPLNPFAGLGVSAAGVSLELTGDGLETNPSNTTDFVIELKLKSGTPIRVRL